MARDRKRAKQRRDRGRAAIGARGRAAARPAGDETEQPPHTPVQGSLEHASAEVDEFDAALVRGAGGAPLPAEEEQDAELAAASEDLLQSVGASDVALRGEERPSGAPIRGGNRVTGFLRASWAELQRVQWPDRRQVFQATAVVLGFVAIAGAYLGLADYVAKEIVEFIL